MSAKARERIRPLWGCFPVSLLGVLGDRAGESSLLPSEMTAMAVARYLERVRRFSLAEVITEMDRMGYREGVEITPVNHRVPVSTVESLKRYSDETGVSREALIALAINQFLRAHGAYAEEYKEK